MAGSVVEASTTLGYGYPGCTIALPPCLCWLLCRSQFSACCLQHKVVYRTGHWSRRFESPQNPSQRDEPLSMTGWPLSVPVMAGVLTTMTTTITSTVVTRAASAGPVYPPYSSQAPSLGPALACLMQAAAGLQRSSARINPVGVSSEAWTSPNGQHAEFRHRSFWGCLG